MWSGITQLTIPVFKKQDYQYTVCRKHHQHVKTWYFIRQQTMGIALRHQAEKNPFHL